MDFLSFDCYCAIRNAAAIIGVLFMCHLIIHQLLDLFSFIRAYIVAPMGIGQTDLLKYGDWAVVTGASEGIGRAYSLELARRGLNVVLMSRSMDKLTKVANEIKNTHGCKCRVIPVNFSCDQDIYKDISDQIRDLDVGILVNNVGVASEYPDYFTNLSAKKMYSIIQINCQAITQMTHVILPGMISRGGGVIVNLSSATSLNPLPQSVVYSATKVFVNYISAGLCKEYKKEGIIVQNVTPFFVATPGTGFEHSNFFIADAATYVKSLVATIGIQENTYGCISHAIQGYFSSKVPVCFSDPIVNRTSNMLRERWHNRLSKYNK